MRLLQVALHADDLDRAEGFYSALLGTEPAARFDPPGLLFFDLDGTRLLLDRGAPSALLYLHVEDLAATLDRWRDQLGDALRVISEPHVIFTHADDALGPAGMQEWQAFLEDSEGNTVGLVAFAEP